MTYKSILKKGLDEIYSMKKNDLAKALKLLNVEANRRLESWSKNTRKTLEPVKAIKERIAGDKVYYFKVNVKMTKQQLIKEIEERGKLLNQRGSTIYGARQEITRKNKQIGKYMESVGIATSNITGVHYAKIRQTLDRFSSQHMQLTDEEYKQAMQHMKEEVYDNPNITVNELYETVKKGIDEYREYLKQRLQNIENEYYKVMNIS